MREAERESAHAGRRGPGRAARAARAFDRSAAPAARALDGPQGVFAHRAQRGGRFSRNAAMPSSPSALARRRAISSQVSAGTAAGSAAVTSRTSFFASAIAVGPPFARSATTPESAASSSAGATTRSTRPQASASAAPKVSPVQKRRRARAAPTRAITKGAIIAGAIPSRTSEKAKCASLEATTTSAAASRPTPPPRAGPLTRATTGRGSSATAANTACVRRASSTFARAPASRMRRIQFRSAPAEKTLPAPVTTTTRTAGSAAHAASASPSRATSAWSSAFPTSGRSRVRVATPSSRSTRSTASALSLVRRGRQDRLGHVELEREQRLRERLPLVVGAQRERAAAPQGMAEEEVERAQPGQLEAFDRPTTEVAEVAAHALGIELAAQEREGLRRAGGDADVGVVALVARACVGDAPERHTHAGPARLRQLDQRGRRRDRAPRAARARRGRHELAGDPRLPAHHLEARRHQLPRHERRPVRVRLLHLRPAAEDAEPGRGLEREAEHRVREALDLAAVGIAHGGAEDALVRLDLGCRRAPAAPVADEIPAPVGELRADAVPEHLREALRLC